MLTKFRCVNYNAKTNFFFRLFGIVLLLYIKLLLNYARNLNLSVSYVGTYVLLYGTSGNVRKASNDYLHLLFAVKNVLNEPRLEQVIVKIFINFCCEIYTKSNRQLALVFYMSFYLLIEKSCSLIVELLRGESLLCHVFSVKSVQNHLAYHSKSPNFSIIV